MRRAVGAALALALAGLAGPPAGRAAGDDFQPEKGFTSLFNGKDLTGWRYKGSKEDLANKTATADGRIQVEGGAIVMMPKDNKGKGGIRDLYTLKDFNKPFHLKLQFRASLKSDSGVYVRGPQLQVRDFIRRGEKKHLKKFKNDDWNDLDVVVRHGVTTTAVNGKVLGPKDRLELTVAGGKPTARLNGKELDARNVSVTVGPVAECSCNGEALERMSNIPAKGGIGLQAEDGKFEFRHVRVKELE
jgi:hypothetical protein